MPTRLYLLRHGATRLNLEKPYRLQGSEVDEPLAPEGIAQSQRARDALRVIPLRAIYTSPLKRAAQTAQSIAQPHGLIPHSIHELREGSVGRWENRTWDDIKASEPDAYHRFITDPGQHGYAGGENFNQVAGRITPVFTELLKKHQNQCFAIVGHQIVNRAYLAGLMGLSMAHARQVKFSNGGITLITLENDKPILVSLNVTENWCYD